MAIAIRGGSPTITGVVTSDPISVSLTGSSQPNTDDVLVIIHGNNFYAATNMPTPTVGGSSTGVTAITNGTADAGTNLAHVKSYTYVVGSTGDLTVAVDETGSADEEKILAVYVLSGADTSTPIDVAGNATGPSATTFDAPSISPTSSDAYLICHANSGGGSSSGAATPPSGMTETYDSTAGGMSAYGAVLQLASSGATGTKSFDPATDAPWGAVSIAVKTSSAVAPPTPDMFVVQSNTTLA